MKLPWQLKITDHEFFPAHPTLYQVFVLLAQN